MMKFPLWIAKHKNKVIIYDANSNLVWKDFDYRLHQTDIENFVVLCNHHKKIGCLGPIDGH